MLQIVNVGVDHGHHQQAEQGAGDEAANHGDGHRRPEAGVGAPAQGQRHHARAHGNGGHDNRAAALVAGVHQGLKAVHSFFTRQNGVVHQQNGVFGHDAHEHDQANHGRHGQRPPRQQQGHKSAANAQGQRRQNGDGLHEIVKQQHQHTVNAQHANQHGNAKAGKQRLHFLGVAELGNLYARRQVLQTRQGARFRVDLAQLKPSQFDFQRDIAAAVQAVNLRRATLQREGGDAAQHHWAVLARHGEALQGGQVGAHGVGQLDANGHLAL